MENDNYYSRNREFILKYNIDRYNTKIKSQDKVRCSCDFIITFGSYKVHLQSKKHILYTKLNKI
jgi:hypothetical protein